MNAPLKLEHAGPVALVTLARPPANAINHDLLRALVEVLPRLEAPDVRAVVLRGEGRFFSAGLDLLEVFTYDEAKTLAFIADFDRAMRGWFAFDKPVVAALGGHTVAGGLVLAATADFRLGIDGPGKLGLTEILVGVPFPATALEPVCFAYPRKLWSELLFRGTTLGMAEAAAAGLVDRLVAPEALDAEALALATELAGHTRAGFSGTKRQLRAAALARLDRAPGEDPIWSLWRDPEVLAQMAAYRDRALKKG